MTSFELVPPRFQHAAKIGGFVPATRTGGTPTNLTSQPWDKLKMLDRPEKRYLQTAQVRRRYGNCSAMWVYRKVRFDPAFPKPLVINQRHFFSVDELDLYDQQQKEKYYDVA